MHNKGRRDLFVVERKIACYFHNEIRTHTLNSFNSIIYKNVLYQYVNEFLGMLIALEDGRSIFPGDDSVLSQIWFSHDAVGHIAVFDWITKPQKLSSVMSLACSAPPERTAPMRAALVFRHPRPPIRSTP